ncbi:alpha/beta hydrolase [candidate division CSSED10-310 bacterium]|uniref:Alpha/beta hydrolase n=1 Tax=candidate division CSSED10-310 bacterium TaxID=2855610 RepID=A0ABV6YSZ2_UNCC1
MNNKLISGQVHYTVSFFVCALLLAIPGLHFAGAETPAQRETLELTPCHLTTPGFAMRIKAECGAVQVPENWADPSGRQISLHVALIRSNSKKVEPDPVFFFAGGPGQAATESYLPVSHGFMLINQKRDIVLIDQRGTGQSNPLRCPLPKDFSLLTDMTEEQEKQWLQDCLSSLAGDPTQYTTAAAVRDFDRVRELLGYEQINIYGVSYGTRVALTYLRLFPDRIRSIILDGVLPQDISLGPNVAEAAQRAIDLIFARCQADPACNKSLPDLPAAFSKIQQDLRRSPQILEIPHPRSGEPLQVRFTYDMFAQMVRLLSYSAETAALLPLLVHNAAQSGDYRILVSQSVLIGDNFSTMIYSGLHHCVACAEDYPFWSEKPKRDSQNLYLGDLIEHGLTRVCQIWPRGDVASDFKQAVTSDVPVLLLSGELDPITPPAYGEHAAKTLSRSLHIVVPGHGHNVLSRGCIPKLATTFIETADVTTLETECVSAIEPMPFFISNAGPEP